MLKNSEGIIIRTVKYGESSFILDIYSLSDGVKTFIVSGVRSKKAKTKPSLIRVMNIVNYVAYERPNQAIHRIKEISYNYIYQSIPFEVFKGSVALFLIEILRKSLKGSEPNKDLYEFVKNRFIELDNKTDHIAGFHIIFLIELAALLGFEIDNNYQPATPYFNLQEGIFTDYKGDLRYIVDKHSSAQLNRILSGETNFQIGKSDKLTLLHRLVEFYKYHVEDFGNVHSLDVLEAIYSKK